MVVPQFPTIKFHCNTNARCSEPCGICGNTHGICGNARACTNSLQPAWYRIPGGDADKPNKHIRPDPVWKPGSRDGRLFQRWNINTKVYVDGEVNKARWLLSSTLKCKSAICCKLLYVIVVCYISVEAKTPSGKLGSRDGYYVWRDLYNTASFVVCVVRRVKDHHNRCQMIHHVWRTLALDKKCSTSGIITIITIMIMSISSTATIIIAHIITAITINSTIIITIIMIITLRVIIYIYIYIYICMYIYIYVYIHICMYISLSLYIYIYIYTHTIYTYHCYYPESRGGRLRRLRGNRRRAPRGGGRVVVSTVLSYHTTY